MFKCIADVVILIDMERFKPITYKLNQRSFHSCSVKFDPFQKYKVAKQTCASIAIRKFLKTIANNLCCYCMRSVCIYITYFSRILMDAAHSEEVSMENSDEYIAVLDWINDHLKRVPTKDFLDECKLKEEYIKTLNENLEEKNRDNLSIHWNNFMKIMSEKSRQAKPDILDDSIHIWTNFDERPSQHSLNENDDVDKELADLNKRTEELEIEANEIIEEIKIKVAASASVKSLDIICFWKVVVLVILLSILLHASFFISYHVCTFCSRALHLHYVNGQPPV